VWSLGRDRHVWWGTLGSVRARWLTFQPLFSSLFAPLSSLYNAMSAQQLRAFQYAKRSLLGLRTELGDVADDAVAASEWIQTFSAALVRRLFLSAPVRLLTWRAF
jgi:hypothetical protein